MSETPLVDLDPTMEVELTSILDMPGSFTGMVTAPGDDRYLYLLQQAGLILRYDQHDQTLEPFLDLTDEVRAVFREKPFQLPFADERGLLGLAFHPDYQTVGSLFHGVFIVMHSELANPELYREIYRERLQQEVPDPDHMTCLAQYQYQGGTPEQTKASRKNILCLPEPQANHNGGGLVFGPDGYLWIGLGDGGGANDEHGPLLDPTKPD